MLLARSDLEHGGVHFRSVLGVRWDQTIISEQVKDKAGLVSLLSHGEIQSLLARRGACVCAARVGCVVASSEYGIGCTSIRAEIKIRE